MNLKKAFETHPTDRPVPKIAVMIKSFERNETYIPNVTNRLVLFSDATGEMLGTVQHSILKDFFPTFVPNTVLVLKGVPIFHRSRFGKQLLVGRQCIEAIFPELDEDDPQHQHEARSRITPPQLREAAPPEDEEAPQTHRQPASSAAPPPEDTMIDPDISDSDDDHETFAVPLKRKNSPSSKNKTLSEPSQQDQPLFRVASPPQPHPQTTFTTAPSMVSPAGDSSFDSSSSDSFHDSGLPSSSNTPVGHGSQFSFSFHTPTTHTASTTTTSALQAATPAAPLDDLNILDDPDDDMG